MQAFCFRFYPVLTGSKTPPQNSVNERNLGGRSTARKSPIDEG
ncbi:spermidine/putrescine ABC transporter ATP-binding protein [Bacillus clarus]|uniref:Spermidine/putrescine ABC transporter ATP-binding protein n=1 Tax=Bacillus clarus TaxID=2338372 RepID=A0ABX9KS82_9BACI|nr:spermidine/putrescine ABC transporter ATP-binding protein [Bacillus clarus]RFT65513.1 spermidine/putrescine ABC transporter ATP-binding protein [Bacillus clarus]